MRKKIVLLVVLMLGLQFVPQYSHAAEVNVPEVHTESSVASPYSQDIIVTKIRSYNGRLQYRR